LMRAMGFYNPDIRVTAIFIMASVMLLACGGSSGGGSDAGPLGSTLPGVNIDDAAEINAVITKVTIASPPVVEFLLTTDAGNPVTGLPARAISFTLAKLVPGTDGQTSHWQSYINDIEEPGVGPGT